MCGFASVKYMDRHIGAQSENIWMEERKGTKDLFEVRTESSFGIVEQTLYYLQKQDMLSIKYRHLFDGHNGIKMAFHARQERRISLDQWLV